MINNAYQYLSQVLLMDFFERSSAEPHFRDKHADSPTQILYTISNMQAVHCMPPRSLIDRSPLSDLYYEGHFPTLTIPCIFYPSLQFTGYKLPFSKFLPKAKSSISNIFTKGPNREFNNLFLKGRKMAPYSHHKRDGKSWYRHGPH